MNIKFYVFALSLVGSFFIYSANVNAQVQDNNFCCEFNAVDNNDHYQRSYCQMTSNCTVEQMKTVVPNGAVEAGSIKFSTNSTCVDDKNKDVGNNLGTHCQEAKAVNNSTVTCDSNTPLADCIARRMPNKDGSVGATKTSAGLIDAIAVVINTILGLLGTLFTVMLVYAGIQWIHYGGDSDGKKRSTKRMKNAVIGLAITLSAYAITAFVINNL